MLHRHSENLSYWNGNHFRSWIGPTMPQTAADYAEKMGHLERVFQSANILRECAENWRDGLISSPFTWYLKGDDGDRADAPEIEMELQRWLDWVNQQAIQQDPTSTNFKQSDPWAEFVLSLGVTGEGALRLWQPARYADNPDPIKRIHLHAPKAGSVIVDRSPLDGFIDEIRYSYAGGQERQRQQGDGQLLIDTPADANAEPILLDTGDRWLIQHCTGESIFTPSVKRLQNALNHALTMMVRNLEVAGFREKVFANAEFPEGDVERGPGVDTYLYGLETELAGGGRGVAPVTVHESQPVDNASLAAAIEVYRRMIYMQFAQGHLLSAGDGSLSGESRIQMRAQFELNLKGWQRRIESAIANILNIVVRLLGYEGYEVVVSLNITTGKLSAEERKEIRDDYQAGLLARSTAIAKMGHVSDPDAEIALIEEEEAEQSAPRDNAPELPLQPLNRTEEDDGADNPEPAADAAA